MIVATDHLSKWYGHVSGLNDVTVALPDGITGLLGPNGAGKSTFMKVVTGQLRPSAGTVRVFGEPIWGNPSQYQRLGFCPEQDAFYEHMTGLEWVTALARLHGMEDASAVEAAQRALEKVDLLDVADRKIGAYSKGMRRRTIRMIREWGRAGKSVVVSSHILHEIEAMTANVVLIHNGRIVAEGDVHQIRALIDEHPHRVSIRAGDPRALARRLLVGDDITSLRFEDGAVIVETPRPDVFYSRLTAVAASGEAGTIDEVTSPDDNLQAVFNYLVKP